MNLQRPALRHVCRACRSRLSNPTARSLSVGSLAPRSSKSSNSGASKSPTGKDSKAPKSLGPPSFDDKNMTPAERIRAAQKRAKENLARQQESMRNRSGVKGSIAPTSAFGSDLSAPAADRLGVEVEESFAERNPANMEVALNPRPHARLQWQRKMVIREVRKRGRFNKTTRLARTEREHTSKSHFFKTSMKKLAPLARQIAGKSIDEAILQMRFSSKKVAQDVREHLIQARNEAVVMAGMGLGRVGQAAADDPSIAPPPEHQTPLMRIKKTETKDPTDMYITQAWVNRGPYDKEPEYRARGNMNILRPPYTGLSVVLKEEKTRTRQKTEKEERALKKRTGKNMWVHLPDRPVTTQRQHVLW